MLFGMTSSSFIGVLLAILTMAGTVPVATSSSIFGRFRFLRANQTSVILFNTTKFNFFSGHRVSNFREKGYNRFRLFKWRDEDMDDGNLGAVDVDKDHNNKKETKDPATIRRMVIKGPPVPIVEKAYDYEAETIVTTIMPPEVITEDADIAVTEVMSYAMSYGDRDSVSLSMPDYDLDYSMKYFADYVVLSSMSMSMSMSMPPVTPSPSPKPSPAPSSSPSVTPSSSPSVAPSSSPSAKASSSPSAKASSSPSAVPSAAPSSGESPSPSNFPTASGTSTKNPIAPPTSAPPSSSPSASPSDDPTPAPSASPSPTPISPPSPTSSAIPSASPSEIPTKVPTSTYPPFPVDLEDCADGELWSFKCGPEVLLCGTDTVPKEPSGLCDSQNKLKDGVRTFPIYVESDFEVTPNVQGCEDMIADILAEPQLNTEIKCYNGKSISNWVCYGATPLKKVNTGAGGSIDDC